MNRTATIVGARPWRSHRQEGRSGGSCRSPGVRGKFQETLVVELGSLATNHGDVMTRDNGVILFTWICFLGDL